MAEKLGLQKEGETAFMDGYLHRVRELPGCEHFRTGVSLRAPFKGQSDFPKLGSPESLKLGSSQLSKPGSLEDRFILLVSFPYFGSTEEISLGPENESVGLLDFKRLGVDIPDRKMAAVSEEERDDMGKILVHQARYMIFDNCKLHFFAYS